MTTKEYQDITDNWDQYLRSLSEELYKGDKHYHIKDIVEKTSAGVASTGLKRYFVLIEGKRDVDQDDVILEIKEARPAIPAYFVPYHEEFWEHYSHQGKRIVATQKAMHHQTDAYLGYLTIGKREFYVRERCPFDKDIPPKYLTDKKEIKQSVKIMGKIAAKIHARADQDIHEDLLHYHSEDEIWKAIDKNTDAFIHEMVLWSRFYKRQVDEDYQLFLDWLKTKLIKIS